MTTTVGAFEAKTHLSELLQRVEHGEHITITKHGRVVARLIPGIEQEPETNWSEFWERADSRLVTLGHGSSIKADIESGRD
ncbi:MAG: type II toxin-antitoxin system prevent-host-death family antitoxin [Candidatus Nanopelagicales bacterium]|jgi:prevent-host-death family protein